jgi:hypothetical protein
VEHEHTFNQLAASLQKQVDKARKHAKRHQKLYCFGAGVMITSVTVFVFRSGGSLGGLQNTAFLVLRNRQTINNVIITQLERRGHPGYIVKCNETGEVFASIARGAEAMGVNRGNLSSHLSGKLPHVGGNTFQILGEAT